MRWPNKILALASASLGIAGAENWKVTSASGAMNATTGCGKLGGPVSLSSGRWTFTSSREALVTAKSKIVRTGGPAGKSSYSLDTSPSRFVFMGRCQARDHTGAVVLEAPFMILDLDAATLTSRGSGITCRSEARHLSSTDAGSAISIDLDSGLVSLEGGGWTDKD